MSEPEGRDLRMLDEQIGVAREALGVAVAHYRAAGWSWARIGRALGVSRQAAWERFHRDVEAES